MNIINASGLYTCRCLKTQIYAIFYQNTTTPKKQAIGLSVGVGDVPVPPASTPQQLPYL